MDTLEEVLVKPEPVDEEDYDTSDKEQVNKARKRSSRTRADRLKFVNAAMTVPEGRAWFYDFLIRCHVFNTPFDDDPYRHAFRAGEANVGLQVLGDIQETAPDNYTKMIRECKRTKE